MLNKKYKKITEKTYRAYRIKIFMKIMKENSEAMRELAKS